MPLGWDKIKKENQRQKEQWSETRSHWDQRIIHPLSEVKADASRVATVTQNVNGILDDLDRDFQKKTGLNSTDVILLFLCTALQCARQYLLPSDAMRFRDEGNMKSNQKGDAFMRNTVGKIIEEVKPEWNDVLFQSVPYDAIRTGPHVHGTGLSGMTHRYKTLGHDPVLGWVFGTANIMTNSLTKDSFETFQVKGMTIIRHYPGGVLSMMERAAEYAGSDPQLLMAAVARQAIHYGSDMFTKQGLPVPGIMVVNNDLAKQMMTKWHIDTWNLVRGTGVAALINQLIWCIHRLFYQEERDGTLSLYECRTRKVLSYSNLIATSSNVIVTAISRDMSKLDVGGIIVTLHRLISDQKFIREVKQDFLKNEFYSLVVGEEYDFMRGNSNEL